MKKSERLSKVNYIIGIRRPLILIMLIIALGFEITAVCFLIMEIRAGKAQNYDISNQYHNVESLFWLGGVIAIIGTVLLDGLFLGRRRKFL